MPRASPIASPQREAITKTNRESVKCSTRDKFDTIASHSDSAAEISASAPV